MRLRAGRRPWWALLPIIPLLLAGCGSDPSGSSPPLDESITLYTCVSDTTIQPIIEKFQAAKPGREVRTVPGSDGRTERSGGQ